MVHDVIESMGRVVEMRDPYTQGHQTRVAALGKDIAIEMGLGREAVDAIEMAGLVHDIGKLSVPAEILSKPGKLSPFESLLMRLHPMQGYEILKDIAFPWPVATIVLQHHERMDGSGYPDGLRKDKLLLEARILSVADVVEAMASHRPYRPAHPVATAICEIDTHREWFDPDAVSACMRLYASGRLRLEAALGL
jgi:putative nucleotidyltransferase with HDIG domain